MASLPHFRVLPAPPRETQDAAQEDVCLRFFVVHTSAHQTTAAIQMAERLAQGLNASVTVLVANEVPYPLLLTEPPVSAAFTEERLRELVGRVRIPVRVEVRLCRERDAALREALPPASLVVMGVSHKWFEGRQRRLATLLARDGHKLVLVGEETNL